VKTTTVSYVPYPVVLTKPNTLAYVGVVKVMGVVEVEVVVAVEVVVVNDVEDGLVVFFHPLKFDKYKAEDITAMTHTIMTIAFLRRDSIFFIGKLSDSLYMILLFRTYTNRIKQV
jgi:hypothetical protein